MGRLPALFISHGMPSMAVEPGPTGRFLAAWPGRYSRPRAIVCISAHLEAAHALLTADARPVTLHDFGGFSPALHAMHYRAPGDPILASRVVSMLRNAGFQSDLLSDRGLDHGAASRRQPGERRSCHLARSPSHHPARRARKFRRSREYFASVVDSSLGLLSK